MSDILEVLRAAANHPSNQHGPNAWLVEAADTITSLRAENARLRAALTFTPTHRHVKRGGVYEVIGRGLLQTSFPLEDNQRLVFYRAKDGTLWARPEQEFHDGRFETLGEPG